MKKLLLLSALFISTNSFALQPLTTFNEIKTALITGQKLRIVFDIAQCTFPPSTKPVDKQAAGLAGVGAYTPNEIFFDGTANLIAASLPHFTLNDPRYLNRPVYDFDRYTITPDNNITVINRVLDATNYAILGNSFSFTCKLGVAAVIYI